MPVVERIAGPGITPNDIELDLPACVKLDTPQANEDFKKFADTIVKHALRHASDTLRAMLASTPNAAKLADEFAERLGL
jgi:hypothetical protein